MAIDIESGATLNEEGNPNFIPSTKLESEPSKEVLNGLTDVERSTQEAKVVNESGDLNHGDKVGSEGMHLVIEIDQEIEGVASRGSLDKNVRKEKRKSLSAKKPPKPPRPPREFPLDAADQKLAKEIAELAMIKRARIGRMKALKKSRVAKASNSSSASGGSYLAMLLTFLVCVLLVCHGFSSKIKSAASSGGSLLSTGGSDGRYVLAEDHMILASSRDSNSSPSGSLNLAEPAFSLDAQNLTKKATN